MTDGRNLKSGRTIPCEGYCDQPYAVVNADGSWTLTLTTGAGHEGSRGQHVVALVTADQGATWEGPFDIEPAAGPEASWVMPFRVPATGRLYAFYTYNKENRREVRTVDGCAINRVDSLGGYAYKYSDDGGRSWSAQRYEIPMRLFACDRENVYGGKVLFFWGVGKPFVHAGCCYVACSKVGGFGRGFFVQNEGVLFRSPNLLTEPDPARHEWETLPAGEIGLRTPEGGGPIAAEFNATPMADGSLFGAYRTIDGFACQAYSRDNGATWERDWMRYGPAGRKVKNPRAANFVRRFSNGKYLYWFHFHGGAVLARAPEVDNWVGYEHRNPVWLCGGVERAGRIHWSQPEIALYDDEPGVRISYPDFIEQAGRVFVTETQKTVARVHELDPALLAALWRDTRAVAPVRAGLLAEWAGAACARGARAVMPDLPVLHDRGLANGLPARRGGFTLELWARFADLAPWQVLFDSRDAEGRGLLVQMTDRGTVRLAIGGRIHGEPGGRRACGMTGCEWDCDRGLLRAGGLHHVAFVVDGGPRTITVLVDGVVCDGGEARQYGWGRFHPWLRDANGAPEAVLGAGFAGELRRVRIHGRPLWHNELAANFEAGPDDAG